MKLVSDVLLAMGAWGLSAFLFVGGAYTSIRAWHWGAGALAIVALFQLTRQHYRLFGIRDLLRLLLASLSLLLIGTIVFLARQWMNLAVAFDELAGAALFTFLFWLLFRVSFQFVNERYSAHIQRSMAPEGPRHRSLILGAGRAGYLVAQELKHHPELGIQVVGFLDDAPEKRGIQIQGIPIFGSTRDLPRTIRKHGITQVILAMPSASGITIRRLSGKVREQGIEVKTVPGIYNFLGNQTWKPSLQDVSIEDLLRREPVLLDQQSLGERIFESTVLITGAGGSIGSELARQIAAFHPGRIVLLGRGENSLWTIQRELQSNFPNQNLSLELCDVRNPARLRQVFERWHPRFVLHAAAHKHVPYLETNPEEAVDNNIFGTLNLVEVAQAFEVSTFVNISTDKSVNPVNVLGASKYIAERIVLRAAAQTRPGHRYLSVRFGNVLGSRGSVVPIFREQIQKGGPLTVTHPDMTRYFMTIPEASQLVIQAGILGENGKVYVLDMGDPVKILDLAMDMARLSGVEPGLDIDIVFTGTRPGEKLFEELFNAQEQSSTDVHLKVLEAHLTPLMPEKLSEGLDGLRTAIDLPEGERQSAILRQLIALVPTYRPSATGLGRYAP